jgi:predicted ArsR family transcriptional regulator
VTQVTTRHPELAGGGEIRNTGVVKTTGTTAMAATAPASSERASATEAGRVVSDGGTKAAVARLLLERGPVTAAEVAAELRLSAAAVRRHLDSLLADGEATTREAPRRGRRGRGRPARLYLLTEAGRVRFWHGYDDLAVAALRYLAETGGPDAVRMFAQRRAVELVAPHQAAVKSAGTVAARADALAEALTAQGYAAAARQAGNGEQLCQHHCPVAHVAARFPELCEAETRVFAELLGTHVQRLATIARGDAACTTHVPLGMPGRGDLPRAERLNAPTTNIPKGRQPV